MIICHEKDHKYAAVHNGSECACLDEAQYKRLEQTSLPNQCDLPCTANKEDICGGRNTASVYLAVWARSVQSDDSGGVVNAIGKSCCYYWRFFLSNYISTYVSIRFKCCSQFIKQTLARNPSYLVFIYPIQS